MTKDEALKRYQEAEANAEASFRVSLSEYVGKRVVDVLGHATSGPYDAPAFQLSTIVLDDGTKIWVEGEHDHPYIVASNVPGLNSETLGYVVEKTE